MSDQELAKLEGLVIGLDQRGEKSAAQQVRWAHAEVERLTSEVMEQARCNGMGAERELALRAEIERLKAQATEAVAFLDGLADRIEPRSQRTRSLPEAVNDAMREAAIDCRAMAAKLRALKGK